MLPRASLKSSVATPASFSRVLIYLNYLRFIDITCLEVLLFG